MAKIKWKCPGCRDSMNHQLRRAHLIVCWALTRLERKQVKRFLEEMGRSA